MRAFRETQANRKIKEIEELNLEQTRIVPNRLFCERERERERQRDTIVWTFQL
jgi:hypothetical protein